MDVKHIIQNLQEFCGIKPESRLVVGVSGGADSVCLMDLLQKSGYELIIAHFNHHLRKESDADAQFVKKIAKERRLKVIIEEADICKIAQETHQSIEVAARNKRYEFLFNQAEKNKAVAVAVGHTADDQVETVLMHIIRGCGLDGLQGMTLVSKTQFNSRIPLIRPLLFWWKEEILQHCQNNDFNFITDVSNADIKLLRNRIRHELIPLLKDYNPAFKDHVFNLSMLAAQDLKIIDQKITNLNKTYIEDEGTGFIKFSLKKLKQQPSGVQSWMMKKAIERISPNSEEMDFSHIQKLIQFIKKPGPSKYIALFERIEAFIEKDSLIISIQAHLPIDKDWPQIAPNFQGKLSIPGSLKINKNWYLICDPVSKELLKKPEKKTGLNYLVFLDREMISKNLTVRSIQPGDKYAPLGMNGKTQKVSDFWINHKLPKRARANWPLIFSGSQIAWIPGFQPAHFCRIKIDSGIIVKLELIKKE